MEAILDNSSDDESLYLPGSESPDSYRELTHQHVLPDPANVYLPPLPEVHGNAKALQLFSGEPLLNHNLSRSAKTYQSSPSQSPSPGLAPPANQVDLSDMLMNNTIPESGPLAPIRRSSLHSSNESSSSSFPSAVFPSESNSSISNIILKSPTHISHQELMEATLRKSIEEPPITSDNIFSYRNNNSSREQSKIVKFQNSGSLPTFISSDNGNDEEISEFMDKNSEEKNEKSLQHEPSFNSLNISTSEMMAPALLRINPAEMQHVFQRQIINDVSTSSASSSPSSSISTSEMKNQEMHTSDSNETSEQLSTGQIQQQFMQNGVTETAVELPKSLLTEQHVHKISEIINRYLQTRIPSTITDINRAIVLAQDGYNILLKREPSGQHKVYFKTADEQWQFIMYVFLESNHQSSTDQNGNSEVPRDQSQVKTNSPPAPTAAPTVSKPNIPHVVDSHLS